MAVLNNNTTTPEKYLETDFDRKFAIVSYP